VLPANGSTRQVAAIGGTGAGDDRTPPAVTGMVLNLSIRLCGVHQVALNQFI